MKKSKINRETLPSSLRKKKRKNVSCKILVISNYSLSVVHLDQHSEGGGRGGVHEAKIYFSCNHQSRLPAGKKTYKIGIPCKGKFLRKLDINKYFI